AGARPRVAPRRAPGGRDEPASPEAEAPVDEAYDPRFSGSRFGVVLHEVLEFADFAAWQDWQPGDPAPAGEEQRIGKALRNAGYAEADLEDGIAVLTRLAGNTLTVPLPEGARLAALPEDQRRAEIEFQFALAPTRDRKST